MARWKIWTGLVVLFISGAVIGGVVTHCWMQSQLETRWEASSQAKRPWMLQRLTRKLDLTDGQKAGLEPVVNQAQEELFALRAQQQPQVEAIWGKTLAAVKPVLTPEQQPKLAEFQQKLEQRWQRSRDYLKNAQAQSPAPPTSQASK